MARVTALAPVFVVPEIQEALDYYRDKLGFEVEGWAQNPAQYGYARRDGFAIHFNHGEQPLPNSEVVQPDLYDVYAYTDDVRSLYEELRERGAALLHEPIERPWQMLEIRVQDPFGYILAFGERI